MSLASTLRPVGISFNAPSQSSASALSAVDVPFHHEPDYLQLQRMLIRYQNLILLTPISNAQDVDSSFELTPLQRRIKAELYSTLPYHRAKWLHSIESARNLILALERQAQLIKSPRAKKEALKDLASKRQIVKKLRNRVEEIGREVENSGDKTWKTNDQDDEELLGERADVVLAKMGRPSNQMPDYDKIDKVLKEGKPVTNMSEEDHADSHEDDNQREALFGSSIRRRQGHKEEISNNSSSKGGATTSGFSNLAQTEKSLQKHTREHEDLTTALVSMAAQLKQQSRAFQFSLTQDENFLNRAVEGLDLNLTNMQIAGKNMAFLQRMSEEQGFFGRLKLYAMIAGMWVFAFLLVFAGPKLRF